MAAAAWLILAGPAAAATAKPAHAPVRHAAAACDDDNPAVAAYSARIRAATEPHEKLGIDLSFRAEYYMTAANYRCAIRDYTQATAINPDDSDNWIERGDAYALTGDYASAIADFTRYMGLQPSSDEGVLERAYARLDSGDFAHALADYSAAIRMEAAAGRPSVFISFGAFYLAAHQPGPAYSAYAGALKDDAPKVYARLGLAPPPDAGLADVAAVARLDRQLEVRTQDEEARSLLSAAVADAAVADQFAYDLYGRGLAEQRLGQTAAGAADMALAEGIAAPNSVAASFRHARYDLIAFGGHGLPIGGAK